MNRRALNSSNNSVSPWKGYLLVGLIFGLLAGIGFYSFQKGMNVHRNFAPLLDAVMQSKLEISRAHAVSTEMISGIQPHDFADFTAHLDSAIEDLQQIVEGDSSGQGKIVPLKNEDITGRVEKIQLSINELERLTQHWLKRKAKSAINTDYEEEHGAVYDDINARLNALFNSIQQIMKREERAFLQTRGLLLFIVISLCVLFWGIFYLYEREKKENFLALQRTNQRLSSLIGASPLAIVTLDGEGKVLSWSPAAERIFGWKEAEVIGKFNPTVPEAFGQKFLRDINEIINHLIPISMEVKCLKKDGSFADVRIFSAPVADENVATAAVLGIMEDISERIQLDEALKKSEEKFRNLFDSSRDAIVLISPKKGFTACNFAAQEMFGCANEEEFLKYSVIDLSPEFQPDGKSSQEKYWELIDLAVKGGSHFFEWLHKRLDGSEFYTSILLSRMEIADDIILQATIRDITEQKKAIEELETTKLDLENLFRSVDDMLIVIDDQFNLIRVNDTACRWFGVQEASEVLNRKCYEVFHQRKEICVDCPSQKAFASGKAVHLEKFSQGLQKYLYVSASPVFGSDGETVKVTEIARDITRRKETEKELQANEEKYRVLFESSADGILIADVEKRKFTHANRAICEMLGYSAEEILKLGIEDIHPKEALPQIIAEFEAQAREEKTMATDIPTLCKDGEIKIMDIGTVKTTLNGISCNVGFFRDISRRKKIEEEIKARMKEIEDFNNMAVDRELRMIELKEEINQLLTERGEMPRYQPVE